MWRKASYFLSNDRVVPASRTAPRQAVQGTTPDRYCLSSRAELAQKLQHGDAFGAPRGLAIYHWVLREFDAAADRLEKAIDQHDPGAALMPWLWYGRELRSTPRWATLMRKLNLPQT